jgi:O-antigen/teichoic acid export membrane protein
MSIAKILYQSIVWRGLLYIATFLLNILIARHFEAAVSGNIYYIISIFSLVHLVGSLSMESGIIYFGATKAITPLKLFNFSLLWTLIAGGLLWVGLSVFAKTSFPLISLVQLKMYAILFICGNLLYGYSSSLFFAQKNFLVPNVISLFLTVLLIIAIPYNSASFFPVINDGNYFFIYFLFFLVQGLATALAFYLFKIKKVAFTQPSTIDLKLLLRYSLMAWLGNIIFFLLYRIDYWFVEKYCSSEALGNYIQVSKLAQLFFLLPSMIATAILPLAATESKAMMARWLALISRCFLYIYALICLVFLLTGKWLFPAIFGESFVSMYAAFIWLVPGILSLSTLFTLTAYNAGKNKLKVNMLGCLYALIVVIAGNWWLVPIYGINAAAGVSSAGYIIYQVYLLRNFSKENHQGIIPFFVFKFEDITSLKKLLTASKK